MLDGAEEKASANFRALVDRNADAILVVDRDGVVQLANPAAESLFRRSAKQLVGNRFGYPIVPDTKAEIEVVRSGEVTTAEMRLVDIEWKGSRAYLASLRDVSDRKQAEEALDAARREQLEIKDRLLSHVSHELRTPLAAIHEFVSLVLDGVGGTVEGEQREYLELAFRNVKQLTSLIDDLAEVSRAQSGKLRVDCRQIDPAHLVEESVRSLEAAATAAGVELTGHCQGDMSLALGDETRTRQILSNLIENAIKFTPEGGSVRVQLQRDPDDPAFVRFSVADTGCGIRPEAVDSVFDRLQQDPAAVWRSRKGLGLGLYICRDLVHRQGGRIWLESEHGKGSIFHFTLPEFSPERLVRSALVDGDRLREAFSMVRIDLVPMGPSGGVPASVHRHAQHVLQNSIYPDVDVLLPRLDPRRGRYWILAGTGDEGMRSLISRLDRRLRDHHDVERHRIDVQLDGIVQHLRDSERQAELTQVLPTLARRIARLTEAFPVPEEHHHVGK